MKNKSDEELIILFQQGDDKAYELIYSRYKDKLIYFLYKYFNNREDAEDMVQETFLKLVQYKDYYTPKFKFSTWLYKIAINLTKSELKKRKQVKYFSIDNSLSNEKDYMMYSTDNNIDALTIDLIYNAIEKLSNKLKKIVVLRDVHDLAYQEIAKIENITLGTVKSRISTARIQIQNHLKHSAKEVYAEYNQAS